MANTTDYRVMTPGSAVAETLQAILAQRRAEARQAYLDKLQEDEMRSIQEARAHAQRMAETTEERLQRLADVEERINLENLFQQQVKLVPPRTTAEDIADADLREQMLRRNLFESRPQWGPPASPDAPMPTVQVYPGTPEQQAAERRLRVFDQLASSFPEGSPQQMAVQAVAEGAPPAIIGMFEPRVPGRLFDPTTGRFIPVPDTQVPASDALLGVLPYAPGFGGGGTGGRAMTPRVYQLVRDGQLVRSAVVTTPDDWLALREEMEREGLELRPLGFQSPEASMPTAGLRQTVARAAATLAAARAANSGPLAWLRGTGSSVTAAEEAYRAALGQLFAQDPAPAAIKYLATQIALDPETSHLPASEALRRFPLIDAATKRAVQLSPAELEHLERLLLSARGAVSGAIPVVE